MFDTNGRRGAALSILLLASLFIACSALKNMGGGNQMAEANKLVGSAKEDLDAVDRISEENEEKTSELTKAENAGNVEEVKKILNDLITAIDDGLKHGESAADKTEQASKLKIDDKYKEYLSYKAQAFRKQIDAFKSLREAAVIERDNYGKGGSEVESAKASFRKKLDDYKKLLADAKSLHRKADDIARENPDKIKSS